ncbi:PEGA domain-containing protein [Pyxidicoccus fallax]|uniref:PEGA domain-containing protein n=1 Tax=Pyxidicoccus fallax TaxID=394095 RepID=A0A848LCQ8_9BACT|nr:PEGA domain-containing protein [Pyxidicoccus fallax]NMO14061.1 PEGA domain-containing protein [Pyxidicoccus fallax]NPC85989.1 PEGA domain-containing protein [Pyxidicoccus fallax]
MKSSALPGLALAAAWMMLWATAAEAQQARTSLGVGETRPWARGVAAKDQQTAQALFLEGNERLQESVFIEAVRQYEWALKHWNHPAIHYNLALALMNLDRPVEVHKHLVAAIEHGPEPLDTGRYEHALSYKALIEKQLAWLEVTCDVPGATVTLNGQSLFSAPGQFKGLVRPGMYSLVALKGGYLPTEKGQPVMPGEKVQVQLKLYTSDEVTQYRRRWSSWLPWSVVGAGMAVAGGGALLHMNAHDRLDAFDTEVRGCSQGCPPGPGLVRLRTQANTLQNIAVGSYVLGGAALTTGAVLLYLNRAQPYRINPDDPSQTMLVTPLVGAGSGGVLGTFQF